MFIGIEIGGTKLQVGLGTGDGTIVEMWRETVDVALGAAGIQKQIVQGVGQVTANAQRRIAGIGIGFGGPIDDHRRCVIRSHQIDGWGDFPLVQWAEEQFQLPVALGNDADCAGLAEANLGAGQGCNPVFYVTIGSGIGGGLIIDGKVARGTGLGAGEIGHLRMPTPHGVMILEDLCSGWGIERRTGTSVPELAKRYEVGDRDAQTILNEAWSYLAEALCHVIALVCPQRIVIGGGVALTGEHVLFSPLRHMVAERVFRPFAGCYKIVPAALGESVVVQGAIELAKSRLK